MAQILNVQPVSGQVESRITITLQYDAIPGGGSPNVSQVLFFDNVDAPLWNVTDRDSANRTLTIKVEVPLSAATGPIEVDLDGSPPIASPQNFTVIPHGPNPDPLTVTQVAPAMPANGYQRGSQLTITLSRQQISPGTRVFFPRTAFGPPIVPATAPVITSPPGRVRVTVPIQTVAGQGRIKVQDGEDSALTRVLTFF
jgi:hypothetical protein